MSLIKVMAVVWLCKYFYVIFSILHGIVRRSGKFDVTDKCQTPSMKRTDGQTPEVEFGTF